MPWLLAAILVLLAACGPTRTPPSQTNGTTNGATGTNNGTVATNGSTVCRPLDPSIGPCDPLCQEGCSDGEACSISSPDASSPVESICEADGPGTAGMECDSASGCEPGLGCLSIDGLTFECVKFCRVGGGLPLCEGDDVCTPFDRDERRVGICVPAEDECTQYPDDDCPDDRNCHRTDLGLRCVVYDPDAEIGDSCTRPEECNDAQGCIALDGGSECRELCDPTNPTCAAAEECGRLNDLPYGACVPAD